MDSSSARMPFRLQPLLLRSLAQIKGFLLTQFKMATEELWQKRVASRTLTIKIVKNKPEYQAYMQALRGERSGRTPSPDNRSESVRHFRWRVRQWRCFLSSNGTDLLQESLDD